MVKSFFMAGWIFSFMAALAGFLQLFSSPLLSGDDVRLTTGFVIGWLAVGLGAAGCVLTLSHLARVEALQIQQQRSDARSAQRGDIHAPREPREGAKPGRRSVSISPWLFIGNLVMAATYVFVPGVKIASWAELAINEPRGIIAALTFGVLLVLAFIVFLATMPIVQRYHLSAEDYDPDAVATVMMAPYTSRR